MIQLNKPFQLSRVLLGCGRLPLCVSVCDWPMLGRFLTDSHILICNFYVPLLLDRQRITFAGRISELWIGEGWPQIVGPLLYSVEEFPKILPSSRVSILPIFLA